MLVFCHSRTGDPLLTPLIAQFVGQHGTSRPSLDSYITPLDPYGLAPAAVPHCPCHAPFGSPGTPCDAY